MYNPPKLTNTVFKHNDIVTQISKFELAELRLIAYCLAHYQDKSDNNAMREAYVKDLQAIFNISEKNAYRVIRKVIMSLNNKPLEFTESNGEQNFWNWFSGFVYIPKEGKFRFKLNPDVLPRLVGLEKNFTRYRLLDVYQFQKATTWKIYEILKRWNNASFWKVDVDELKTILNVENKYKRWDRFKSMLDISIKEINETSDINAVYTTVKKGRFVSKIVFKITLKQIETEEENKEESLTDIQKIERLLKKEKVNPKSIENYITSIEVYGLEAVILSKLPNIIKRAKHPKQKYILGALKKEIEENNAGKATVTMPTKPVLTQQQKAELFSSAVKCYTEKKKGKCVRKTHINKQVCEMCLEVYPREKK